MLVGAEQLSQLSSLVVNHLIVHGLFTVCTDVFCLLEEEKKKNTLI